jgi:hypothetical protein
MSIFLDFYLEHGIKLLLISFVPPTGRHNIMFPHSIPPLQIDLFQVGVFFLLESKLLSFKDVLFGVEFDHLAEVGGFDDDIDGFPTHEPFGQLAPGDDVEVVETAHYDQHLALLYHHHPEHLE